MRNLEGRVALITGGSRGIGRAAAVALAEAGADIVLNYLRSAAEADAAATQVREQGRKCTVIQADVADAADVARLAETCGRVDILVNNAGIAQPRTIDEITEADWDAVVDANLKSCFLMTQAVVRPMRERKWGRIINLSSVAAQVGGVVGPHYAASKAGIAGLTHFYASRLAKDGVTVNSIAPALIDTDMVRSNPNASADRIPVGRFGDVDEVSDLIVLLAGNGYITGQTINVNGGWYMS